MSIAKPLSVPRIEPIAGPCPPVNGFSVVQRKLMGLERLQAAELGWIQAQENTALHYEPRTDIVVEGNRAGPLYIQLDGWACRYRLLEDGRRQVLDIVLPGNWYDLTVSTGQPHTASVGALTACRVAVTSHEFRRNGAEAYPNIFAAMEVMRGQTVRRLEESLTMLGRLTAAEAMLMFLSRIFDRLDAVGLVDGDTAPFPLTQEIIGDHLGLSTVHVNRTARVLKEDWGIRIADGWLTIPDPDAVRAAVYETDPAADRLAC